MRYIKLISALALCSAPFAHAGYTVYEDEQNNIELGGMLVLDVFKAHYGDPDKTNFNLNRSRFNIGASRILSDDLTIDAKFEWDNFLKSPNSSDSNFRTRLGYMSFDSKKAGNLRFGKQWSAYHDVAKYMDNMIIIDPDATPIYSDTKDGAFAATGRGDNLVAYRFSHNSWNISAHYGFEVDGSGNSGPNQDMTRDRNYAISTSYDFANGFSLGAAYLDNKAKVANSATVNGIKDGESQTALTLAANYQTEVIKVAAAYTKGEKMHQTNLFGKPQGGSTDWADADAFDIYAKYNVTSALAPFIYYSNVSFDDGRIGANGDRQALAGGISYTFAPGVMASLEISHFNFEEFKGSKQSDTAGGVNLIYVF